MGIFDSTALQEQTKGSVVFSACSSQNIKQHFKLLPLAIHDMSQVSFKEDSQGCGTLSYVPAKYPGYTVVCKAVDMSGTAQTYLTNERDAVAREWSTESRESYLTSVIKTGTSEEVDFHDQKRKRILGSGTRLKVVEADFVDAFQSAQQQWKQNSSA